MLSQRKKTCRKEGRLYRTRNMVLRKELQCAAKALLYVMEKLQDEGELKTYTLRTCTDIGRRIGEWNETVNELEENTGGKKGMILRMYDVIDVLEENTGGQKGMILRRYDVQNMFTAPPREQILKAVDELFEMPKGRKWGRNSDKRLVVVPKLKADRSRLTHIL